jgi:hypothetical protein
MNELCSICGTNHHDPKDHPFTQATLLYCGKCNQRRYFMDGKCEICASLTLLATARQVVRELEDRGTCTNDSLNKLRRALAIER